MRRIGYDFSLRIQDHNNAFTDQNQYKNIIIYRPRPSLHTIDESLFSLLS